MQRRCEVEGCTKKSRGRICSMHRARMERHGDYHTKLEGGGKPRPFEETLRLYVPTAGPNECWEWQGNRSRTSYGRVNWKGERRLAHRVVYEELTGVTLHSDQLLCHTCDNPPCVNPSHLFIGSDADNIADCVAKDRHARGERNGHAKLTPEKVMEARWLYWNTSATVASLATKYGLTHRPMDQLLHGITWKHLPIGPQSRPPKTRGERAIDTETGVKIALRYREGGISMRDLAKEFGVPPSPTMMLLHGNRGYKDVHEAVKQLDESRV